MDIHCTTLKRFHEVKQLLLSLGAKSLFDGEDESIKLMEKYYNPKEETPTWYVRPGKFMVDMYHACSIDLPQPIKELSDQEIKEGFERIEKIANNWKDPLSRPKVINVRGMTFILVDRNIVDQCADFLKQKNLPLDDKQEATSSNQFMLFVINSRYFKIHFTECTKVEEINHNIERTQKELGVSSEIKCIGLCHSLDEFIAILTAELLS